MTHSAPTTLLPPEHGTPSDELKGTAKLSSFEKKFDLEALRLPAAQSEERVAKRTLSIPFGKPPQSSFIRVHPDDTFRMHVATLKDTEAHGEIYVVAPAICDVVSADIRRELLVTTIDLNGSLRLWPLRTPNTLLGRPDLWAESAQEAAKLAQERWIRVVAKSDSYAAFEALDDLPPPEWPELEFDEIMRIATRGRVIDSLGHPLVRKLRGAR